MAIFCLQPLPLLSPPSKLLSSGLVWWGRHSCLLGSTADRNVCPTKLYRYQPLLPPENRPNCRIIPVPGGMAERPIAPVLKTGRAQVLVGSNPTPSARLILRKTRIFSGFFAFGDFKAL